MRPLESLAGPALGGIGPSKRALERRVPPLATGGASATFEAPAAAFWRLAVTARALGARAG
jgi:hypothetical protein